MFALEKSLINKKSFVNRFLGTISSLGFYVFYVFVDSIGKQVSGNRGQVKSK